MNCRPGDIARVFRVTPGWEWAMDRIVRVVSFMRSPCGGDPGWRLAEPLIHPNGRGAYWCVMDSCLKPIRDPGEDAQDESFSWTPQVPTYAD